MVSADGLIQIPVVQLRLRFCWMVMMLVVTIQTTLTTGIVMVRLLVLDGRLLV